MTHEIAPVAVIRTEFKEKFGIPRQSGLVPALQADVIFEAPYRNPDWIRGIEAYSHLWLLWDFSLAHKEVFSPTVCPPRLGGKVHKGVFATRSPFRPNNIGLSCVALAGVTYDEALGPILHIYGADLLDGTPIYDIKPYLPYTDAHPDAAGGFSEAFAGFQMAVDFPKALLSRVPEDKRDALLGVLAQDPRAAYNKKPDFVYGLSFAGLDVRFTVQENTLYVQDVVPAGEEKVK